MLVYRVGIDQRLSLGVSQQLLCMLLDDLLDLQGRVVCEASKTEWLNSLSDPRNLYEYYRIRFGVRWQMGEYPQLVPGIQMIGIVLTERLETTFK